MSIRYSIARGCLLVPLFVAGCATDRPAAPSMGDDGHCPMMHADAASGPMAMPSERAASGPMGGHGGGMRCAKAPGAAPAASGADAHAGHAGH